MQKAIKGHIEEFEFEVTKRQSRRKPTTYLTYLSYADDIALVSKEDEQAQALLTNIEKEVAIISLHINGKKTEVISHNYNTSVNIELKNCSTIIKTVKYLGAWMKDSQNDFESEKHKHGAHFIK